MTDESDIELLAALSIPDTATLASMRTTRTSLAVGMKSPARSTDAGNVPIPRNSVAASGWWMWRLRQAVRTETDD